MKSQNNYKNSSRQPDEFDNAFKKPEVYDKKIFNNVETISANTKSTNSV
jgi:hypothetical protein